MKLVVIIPAYNEENRIKNVIEKTKLYTNNIVVVDDCSKDNTFKEAKKTSVIVLKHIVNLGKGSALKTGCEAALNLNADYIIVLDADEQHDPSEIPQFLEVLEKDNVDFVFGKRKLNENMPFIAKLGNLGLSWLTKILFGIEVSDTQSGYRAFKSSAYEKIKWNSSGYAVETEMIARIGKKKLRFEEIFIKTIYKDKYKGTTFVDGLKIFLNMIIWRLTI